MVMLSSVDKADCECTCNVVKNKRFKRAKVNKGLVMIVFVGINNMLSISHIIFQKTQNFFGIFRCIHLFVFIHHFTLFVKNKGPAAGGNISFQLKTLSVKLAFKHTAIPGWNTK